MRLDRWALAAAAALTVAVLPGAAQMIASSPGPGVERVTAGFERDAVAAGTTEVPITPPGELTGEVAAPSAPAPTFAGAAAPTDGEVYALIIGINDYPGQAHDLRSAVADAETIDAALSGFGVPAGNRVLLRDGQATRPEVEAAVQSLVHQGGPGATYVLAYAGHIRKLDSDTEAMVLADGLLIRDAALAGLLAPADGHRMWILLASCYSGGFTEVLAPGRVLTAAASAHDLAWEDPALNASYMVHYLIREGWLRGKAGNSVQEAFAYADAALARDRPNRRPVQFDEVGAPLVLGAGDPTSALALAPPTPQSAPPPSKPPPTAPPPTTPPTTAPPPKEDEPPCLLGALLC